MQEPKEEPKSLYFIISGTFYFFYYITAGYFFEKYRYKRDLAIEMFNSKT